MNPEHPPSPLRGLIARIPLQFVMFLLISGFAAALNFGSRIVFSHFMPYPAAIFLAFCVGLSTAFVLGRLFVFQHAARPLHEQIVFFVLVNLLGLGLTLGVSLLLARWLLPSLGVVSHVEEIAHAAGIAAPILTSYFGHKHFSFAQKRSQAPGSDG